MFCVVGFHSNMIPSEYFENNDHVAINNSVLKYNLNIFQQSSNLISVDAQWLLALFIC